MPQWQPMVDPLTEQDMADLAAYFASQTTTPGQADQNQVTLGEQVYKGGNNSTGIPACAACHGPNGTGNPAANFLLSRSASDLHEKPVE